MLNIKSFCFNPFEERCTLAWDESGEALIVDPGCYAAGETETLEAAVEEHKLKVKYILLTHAHFDHTFGVSALVRKYGVPVLMDAADKAIVDNNKYFCGSFGLSCPDTWYASGTWSEYASGAAPAAPAVLTLKDGDIISWGEGRSWEVLSTPGHTPGGVCFLDRGAKLLLSGDTLFAGAIGRTDNRWGDYDALIHGIFEKLMTLDGDITVLPGHGPHTSIADERTKNPFLMPFNEPFEEDSSEQEE